MKLNENHPLARVAVAYHDVAEQTFLFAQIEERHTTLLRKVADMIANLIVQIVHQPTFIYGQNLIKSPRDMETDGIHIVESCARSHLLTR